MEITQSEGFTNSATIQDKWEETAKSMKVLFTQIYWEKALSRNFLAYVNGAR